MESQQIIDAIKFRISNLETKLKIIGDNLDNPRLEREFSDRLDELESLLEYIENG